MSEPRDVIQLVPAAPAPTHEQQVSAATVELLERLLARARAGEIVNVVAVTWHRDAPPESHWSTEDKITALGAIRTMEHVLVRAWLDG